MDETASRRLTQTQEHIKNTTSTTMLTLISATPSPFARMNRISLIEKGIPFQLQNEVPWDSTTQTPKYNPLEKLPILIFDDGREPIYDSAYIQEYIVQKFADRGPKLLTGDLDLDLKARQIQTLSEGLMDAFVLSFFEARREEGKRSRDWIARQDRKIDGALGAFEELAKERQPHGTDFLLGNVFTIADIAVCCATRHMDFTRWRPGWREKHPELTNYWEKMEQRDSFRQTEPVNFKMQDRVV